MILSFVLPDNLYPLASANSFNCFTVRVDKYSSDNPVSDVSSSDTVSKVVSADAIIPPLLP